MANDKEKNTPIPETIQQAEAREKREEYQGRDVQQKENQSELNERGGKKAADTVEVKKDTLEQILARIEAQDALITSLDEKNTRQQSEIEMLKTVSDKGRLAKYEEKQRGSLVTKARVAFWEGVPVLGWTKEVDAVGFTQDGRLTVNQKIRVFLDKLGADKKPESVVVEYLYWVQNTQTTEGEVVAKTETDTGRYWKIRLPDGREVTLDIRFINAF